MILKINKLFLSLLPIAISFIVLNQLTATSKEKSVDELIREYKDAKAYLGPKDVFLRASETVLSPVSEDIEISALNDLARYSNTPEQLQKAKSTVEQVLAKNSENTRIKQRAELVKARIAARCGNREESQSLFKRAIREKWDKSIVDEYKVSLWENRHNQELALTEYELSVSDDYSQEIRDFFELSGNFSEMLCRLRAMKVENPTSSAMRDVFPQLKASERRPYAIEIARALCLASDGNTNDALQLLVRIKSEAAGKEKSEYDETKDIPLYVSAVRFFEGKELDQARSGMKEYINAHLDTPKETLLSCLKLMYGMEIGIEDRSKIFEVSVGLMETPLVTDEKIKEQLPQDILASLFDMQQVGLAWQNRFEEAAVVSVRNMAQYYPQTLAGANSSLNYAVYLGTHAGVEKRDIAAATQLLEDIVYKCAFDDILPFAKTFLVKYYCMQKRYDEALTLVNDVIESTTHAGTGPYAEYHEYAKKMKEDVNQLIEYQRLLSAKNQ